MAKVVLGGKKITKACKDLRLRFLSSEHYNQGENYEK